MPPQSGLPISETLPPAVRVHVVGAGPVGLVVAALLPSNDRFSVHLYEKRRNYTRTRMVQLAPYLVADSIASYCTDYIDEESVEEQFVEQQLLAAMWRLVGHKIPDVRPQVAPPHSTGAFIRPTSRGRAPSGAS
jgi:flavin-dependent dehydrogenase